MSLRAHELRYHLELSVNILSMLSSDKRAAKISLSFGISTVMPLRRRRTAELMRAVHNSAKREIELRGYRIDICRSIPITPSIEPVSRDGEHLKAKLQRLAKLPRTCRGPARYAWSGFPPPTFWDGSEPTVPTATTLGA
jgi:hypothetical protein